MPALHTGRSRLVPAALALVLALPIALGASPAYAADPLGGSKLGSKGIVVDPTAPALPVITAQGWLIADLDSGEVLASRNPHGKFLPASTIKTLTAIALLPRLDPKTIVKPSAKAANMEGSSIGLVPGHPISIDLLFTGMLIASGNDSATALAESAGGENVTVDLMNEEAKRLQAGDTSAANPTGLDADGQFSSPYDLALMGRAALKIPAFQRHTSTRQATIPSPKGPFQIANKNRLLYNYEGTFGGKTGGTKKALQTYIGFAQRGNRRIVVTIMKTSFWRAEAPKLLDWGFSAAGQVAPVGVLVEPLEELTAANGGAPGAANIAPAAGGAVKADSAPANKATKDTSGVPRLPSGRWWFGAAPIAVFLIVSALTLRRRRRRRRGFYMPQTKLRLPVR